MFPRIVFKNATSFAKASPLQLRNALVMQSNRTYFKRYEIPAPPMRHLTIWQHFGLFTGITLIFLSYPVYVMLQLDSIRASGTEEFSDELKAQLEERRQLRKEGKLNILVQDI